MNYASAHEKVWTRLLIVDFPEITVSLDSGAALAGPSIMRVRLPHASRMETARMLAVAGTEILMAAMNVKNWKIAKKDFIYRIMMERMLQKRRRCLFESMGRKLS